MGVFHRDRPAFKTKLTSKVSDLFGVVVAHQEIAFAALERCEQTRVIDLPARVQAPRRECVWWVYIECCLFIVLMFRNQLEAVAFDKCQAILQSVYLTKAASQCCRIPTREKSSSIFTLLNKSRAGRHNAAPLNTISKNRLK